MEEVCSCNKVPPRHHGLVQGSGDAAVAICENCLKASPSARQADLKSEAAAEGNSVCEGCSMVISKGRRVSPAADVKVQGKVVHVEASYSYPDGWCGVCSSIKGGHPKCYKCLAEAKK